MSFHEDIIPDIKDIDIGWHTLREGSMKSEPVPEDMESVETRVFVQTENTPFIEAENIKSENLDKTNGRNAGRGTGRGMVEVRGKVIVVMVIIYLPGFLLIFINSLYFNF